MYDITTLGEILIDFTRQGVSESGQKLFAQNPGGAPANMLTAAQRLGAKTAFLGKAGADMHGGFLKETLAAEQVETKGLILDESWFTTLAFVDIGPSGERSFSFARKPGADTQIRKDELAMDILLNTRVFHVGSLSLTDEPARGTTLFAIQKAKEHGSIISYDPNYRASLWNSEDEAKEQMRSILPFVEIIKISDEETKLLTGQAGPELAVEALLNQGVKLVAVTLGKDGAYVGNREGGRTVPGFASKAVDTTGAGDSFWGGFLYKLCESGKAPENVSLDEAAEFARFANAVASICVRRQGGIPAMPTMEEVCALLVSMS